MTTGVAPGQYSTGKLAIGDGVNPLDYRTDNDVIVDFKAFGNSSMFRCVQNNTTPYIDMEYYLHMSDTSVRGLDTSLITIENEDEFRDYAAPVDWVLQKFAGGSDLAVSNLTVFGNTVIGDDENADGLEIIANVTVDGYMTINRTHESTECYNGALVVNGGVGIGKRLNVCGDTRILGNLTVLGNYTVSDVEVSQYEDSLLVLGNGSTGDAQDIGFLGKYQMGNTTCYAGFYRDATDPNQAWKLRACLDHDPNTLNVVNSSSGEWANLDLGNLFVNSTLDIDGDIDADVRTFDVVADNSAATAISMRASTGGIILDVDATDKKLHLVSGGTGVDAIDLDTVGGVTIDATADVKVTSDNFNVVTATDTNVNSSGQVLLHSATVTTIQADTVMNLVAPDVQIDSSNRIDVNATNNITVEAGGNILTSSIGHTRVEAQGSSGIHIGDSDLANGMVNLGTSNTARAINIGSDFSTKVDVNALDIELDSEGPILVTAVTSVTVQADTTIALLSTGALSIDAEAASPINIGTEDTSTGTVNVGTSSSARTIQVGSASSTSVNVDAITYSIDSTDDSNITMTASDAALKTLTVGVDNSGAGDALLALESSNDIDIQAANNSEVVFNQDGLITHLRIEGNGTGGENLFYVKADGLDTSLANVTYSGQVGIGKVPDSGFRLEVEGSLGATGFVYSTSDQRLKNDIRPLGNPLANMADIRGVHYTWDLEQCPNQTNGDQIGFLAQEVEAHYPQVVTTGSDGFKRLCYDRLTCVLWEAVKEQQRQIEELRTLVQG
jgi:hypothetical protein